MANQRAELDKHLTEALWAYCRVQAIPNILVYALEGNSYCFILDKADTIAVNVRRREFNYELRFKWPEQMSDANHLLAMLRHTYEVGKDAMQKEFRDILGAKEA